MWRKDICRVASHKWVPREPDGYVCEWCGCDEQSAQSAAQLDRRHHRHHPGERLAARFVGGRESGGT